MKPVRTGYNELNQNEELVMSDAYRTSDFLEICFLFSHDARLVVAKREGNSDRVTFHFDDRGWCEGRVNALTMGQDSVSASRFLDAIRRTRKIIQSTM